MASPNLIDAARKPMAKKLSKAKALAIMGANKKKEVKKKGHSAKEVRQAMYGKGT